MTSAIDSPVRHVRTPKALVAAVFRPQNYAGVFRTLAICATPIDFLKRYLSNGGSYPAVVKLRSPTGPLHLTTYTSDDVQTINEIFFRNDYVSAEKNTVIVDFGSNIGISASYFLSRNREAFVYCFEPLPQNYERLRKQLVPFEGRYKLDSVAVGLTAGTVRFGWEPTGRYGGVGRETGSWIDVECKDSNEVLRAIIVERGAIDLLKIDIETLEKAVTARIPTDLAAKIRHIVVEYPFAENPLSATHRMIRNGSITTFVRTAAASA